MTTKKTMAKKNSAAKKLIPAAGMLAVSAMMLGTSTFAWFTMNKEVEVTNMQVKARAEAGLLINEVADKSDPNWDDQATALSLPGTALTPTSTTNGTNWFHANSKIASDEAGATANTASANLSGVYEQLSLIEANVAVVDADDATRRAEYSIYYTNNNGTDGYQADTTDTAYYVKYKYYLRVSNESGLTGLAKTSGAQNVAIKSVEATVPVDGDSATSADLDKALRVGVKIGGKMYVYAPVYGSGSTSARYFAVTSITNTDSNSNSIIEPGEQSIVNAPIDAFATDTVAYTALTSLPGMTADGTEVDIYIWFEGEDDYCQSDKITATLDDISINVTFGLETMDATKAAAAAAVGTGTDASITTKNEY